MRPDNILAKLIVACLIRLSPIFIFVPHLYLHPPNLLTINLWNIPYWEVDRY